MPINRIELFEDNIAILPLETADRSQGGIILPETARQKSQRGRVLFVGPGRLRTDPASLLSTVSLARWPMPVAVGDIAIYMKYAGHEIEAGEHTITIMKASELLGRIQEIPDTEAPQEVSEEPKIPAGMDRPPCPICGMEVISGPSQDAFFTENASGYLCEECGIVSVGQDGVPVRRMAQCRDCKKVDFVNSRTGRSGKFFGGDVSRVIGCSCETPWFDVLSPEDAAMYLRGREKVNS